LIKSFLRCFCVFSLTAQSLFAADRPTTRAEAVPSDDKLVLATPGLPGPIPYEKFGRFEGVGTAKYKYVITDRGGLSQAAGEGIYPNSSVSRDPAYQALLRKKELEGNHWNFTDTNTAAKNFYKWATAPEDPGVKQFYTAIMLERAGLLEAAVKGFYAVAVHFPKTVATTYYSTPWYMGPASLDRVEQILRRHPELGMRLEGAKIDIMGKFDKDPRNDVFLVNPGRLVKATRANRPETVDLGKLKEKQSLGTKAVRLRQFENGHWQLLVDEKPFPLRAVTYSVCPVGASPDRQTWDVSKDWQLLDTNKNGKHDGFFESYVDKNGNHKRDRNEPVVGDAKLLKDLGINTFRAYHHIYNKELFRKLYKDYGFRVLCGDLLGVYAVGSGASWSVGTDYADPAQQRNMLESVRKMVEEYKDEPYILMWVLGNENVYGVANNAGTNPTAFFAMVNKAAALIHELDPTRPVALANGDILFMDHLKTDAPNVDVIAANVYRGEQGFGRHLFRDVKELLDKPFFISEYGASAYGEGYTKEQAEAYHAMYLANNWEDMEAHMAGRGEGNVLGGVLFEWSDEWWKANADLPESVQKGRAEWYAAKAAGYKNLQPENHDTLPQFGLPFIDGWSYEEWFGLTGQGDGKDSPFVRVLRPAYHTLRKMWR